MLQQFCHYMRQRKQRHQKAAVDLRAICDQVGKEFECKSYDALLENSEENFEYPDKEYGGYNISFSGEACLQKNGDIHYTLDLHCNVPFIAWALPSYVFYKRKDGSVYYG